MDTRLRNTEEWKTKAGQIALGIFEDWTPDVVIACDDNAMEYFVTKIPSSSNVPVVFCGINNDPALYGYPAPNMTGIYERPFPIRSLELCSAIVPDIHRVAVVGDESSSTEGNIDFIKKNGLGRFENAGFYKFNNRDNLLLGLQNLEKISDVFYITRTTIFKNEQGEIISTSEVTKDIMNKTNNPVVGLSDYIVYDGALCGVVPDSEFHGSVSAEIALEIVYNGKTPEDFNLISGDSPFSPKKDGEEIINLVTAREKHFPVPVELINEADVLVSSLGREEEIALDYYQMLSNNVFTDSLRFLRTLSSKDYTKKGDWERIKADFLKKAEIQEKSNGYSALYFYIRPDGEYYTHIRNLTGVNLKDRDYFSTLEKGQEVHGAPIIGKTSGRKSAVFAVPVEKNGEIAGYVAMSLFMEGINSTLNNRMALNKLLLFAINDKGKIMLTNREGFLYSNIDALLMSDKEDFMKHLEKTERGQIAFEDTHGQYLGLFKTNPLTGWKLVLAKKVYDFTPGYDQVSMLKNVDSLKEALSEMMSTMEDSLLKASSEFAANKELPENLEEILKTIYSESPYALDVAFVNTKGVMKVLYPEAYKKYEGVDISDQEQIKKISKIKKPVISELFMSEEDCYAIDVEWPVFNNTSAFKGSLSILLKPEDFFKRIFKERLENPDFELWVMQNDGTIIYDTDSDEIGKNLFKSKLYASYEELISLGKEMINSKTGSGDYTFLETGKEIPVTKEAVWTTVRFHETDWKIVLTKKR